MTAIAFLRRRWYLPLAALVVALLLVGQHAGRAEPSGNYRPLLPADAIASAKGELQRIARETGASIIIETVESLEGEPADRVAVGLARRSGIRGVFILIARKERKLEVLGSGHYKEILTDAGRTDLLVG